VLLECGDGVVFFVSDEKARFRRAEAIGIVWIRRLAFRRIRLAVRPVSLFVCACKVFFVYKEGHDAIQVRQDYGDGHGQVVEGESSPGLFAGDGQYPARLVGSQPNTDAGMPELGDFDPLIR